MDVLVQIHRHILPKFVDSEREENGDPLWGLHSCKTQHQTCIRFFGGEEHNALTARVNFTN